MLVNILNKFCMVILLVKCHNTIGHDANPYKPHQDDHHDHIEPQNDNRQEIPHNHNEIHNQPNGVQIQQEGVPIQQEGVPIQQEGVPIQQEGVPIQQQEVPIHQQQIPNQQEGVLIQQQHVPNQQQVVPIQQQQVLNQQEGVPNQQEGVTIQQEGVPNQQEGVPIQQQGVPHQQWEVPVKESGEYIVVEDHDKDSGKFHILAIDDNGLPKKVLNANDLSLLKSIYGPTWKDHLTEHILTQPHLASLVETMSVGEPLFHFFITQDLDKNYHLDGLELMHSLIQEEDHHNQDSPHILSDAELESTIDQILLQHDLDRDGFLSYAEFMKKQNV